MTVNPKVFRARARAQQKTHEFKFRIVDKAEKRLVAFLYKFKKMKDKDGEEDGLILI